MNLSKQTIQFIKDNKLIEPGDKLLVAVSGGSDSMGLLAFLFKHKEMLKIESISAAHINHQLRPFEADRDQQVVESYCKSLGIPCYSLKVDVNEFAKETKQSIEATAREVRYEFLEEMAKEFGEKIVTGHTLDDHVETVLFHLVRGVSLKGLCGIPLQRGNIIRPFLNTHKAEVQDYCNLEQIPFVIDSTNFEKDYTRNKIRLEIIPLLEEINTGFTKGFYYKTASLREDSEYLEQVAKEYKQLAIVNNKLNKIFLRGLHQAIAKRLIILYLQDNTIEISNSLVNDIYSCINKSQPGQIQIADATFLEWDNNFFAFTQKKEVAFEEYQLEIKDGNFF